MLFHLLQYRFYFLFSHQSRPRSTTKMCEQLHFFAFFSTNRKQDNHDTIFLLSVASIVLHLLLLLCAGSTAQHHKQQIFNSRCKGHFYWRFLEELIRPLRCSYFCDSCAIASCQFTPSAADGNIVRLLCFEPLSSHYIVFVFATMIAMCVSLFPKPLRTIYISPIKRISWFENLLVGDL